MKKLTFALWMKMHWIRLRTHTHIGQTQLMFLFLQELCFLKDSKFSCSSPPFTYTVCLFLSYTHVLLLFLVCVCVLFSFYLVVCVCGCGCLTTAHSRRIIIHQSIGTRPDSNDNLWLVTVLLLSLKSWTCVCHLVFGDFSSSSIDAIFVVHFRCRHTMEHIESFFSLSICVYIFGRILHIFLMIYFNLFLIFN